MYEFSLDGKVAIITGGEGFLGRQHGAAIERAGGIPILADITSKEWYVNIVVPLDVEALLEKVLERYGTVDILINNAANNPKLGSVEARLENFSPVQWWKDLDVGLTGAFLCSQIIGGWMAEHGGGVIINVASDLGVIAPDQRIYEGYGAKPVTYSVVKHGIIGLTKYLATYWADKNIRVNSISPGGMYNNQPQDMVERIEERIPMGRMAERDEYHGAIVFLCSEASSYMTGANLVIDGGRTVW